MDFLAELVCDEDFLPAVCEDVIFLLMGFDKAQFNETLLDTIVHHSPAGTSARAIVHYAQEVNSGIIQITQICFHGNLHINCSMRFTIAFLEIKGK